MSSGGSDRGGGRAELPTEFVRWARGCGLGELLDALDNEAAAPVSVRLNPEKVIGIEAVEALELPLAEPVPWVNSDTGVSVGGAAFYLRERPVFTADPAFHGGAYYVQEAGSMVVGALMEQELARVERHGALYRVLDLCAAPGGKTTHVASLLKATMGGGGVVVANEVIRPRAKVLTQNVQKWGTGNVLVTSSDPVDFGERLPGYFDALVVDAPCSGEGMFRKDPAARAQWSPDNVRLSAARQRRIVCDAWPALRDGGVLVYSTCTFNEHENQENARWIADQLGGELLHEQHFYPHQARSEGFYVALIRKMGEAPPRPLKGIKGSGALGAVSAAEAAGLGSWLPGPAASAASAASAVWAFGVGRDGQVYGYATPQLKLLTETLLERRFNLLYSGVQLGELIRGELKPSPALALYGGLRPGDAAAAVALGAPAAAEYLRKGSSAELLPPALFAPGLNLVTYRNIALGWIKRIGPRLNNLYPSTWRVLHY